MRTAVVTVVAILVLLPSAVDALGSASTVAITSATGTVCGILAGGAPRGIQCAAPGATQPFSLPPNVSFVSVSGGRDFFCGLLSGGLALLCWNVGNNSDPTSLARRRVYIGGDTLRDVSVGDDQVAAVKNGTGVVFWRRKGGDFPPSVPGAFRSLTSGRRFSCGITGDGSVRCWGRSGDTIQRAFANVSMSSIVAGDSHACGLTTRGFLICRGSNSSGQSNAPSGDAFEFSGLALGADHSCAIRRPNGTVLCWGRFAAGFNTHNSVTEMSFVLLVAGGNLTCGLMTTNYSIFCWVLDGSDNPSATLLPLPSILPGLCTADQSSCDCGIIPDSETQCSGSGVICSPCVGQGTDLSPAPSSNPPPNSPPPSRGTSKGFLAFAIVGSVGGFAGVCTVLYCLWTGVCRQKKVHNSVQPTISAAARNGDSGAAHSPATSSDTAVPGVFTSPLRTRSRIFRRQSSRAMKRQRSGTSRNNGTSFKAEEFTFSDLAAATKNFSLETKIGAGSFGSVYKGKLPDGREVAIKRSESGPKTKKFQEKESAFQSELAFLSRLHHKHLVGLVGFCEEREERLLVYDFMKNGALYDHLHSAGASVSVSVGVMNSWRMRIKVLLDAARGVEYLHSYAVPPIIHRDIKSSNILLDGNWVARVSDFGLSLIGPETGEEGHISMRAAGTVGYMDPEYYGLHQLTTKSDVYGLGVVMLEVLTGRRAIFKEEEGGNPKSVVDYAVPAIVAGELGRVLDPRVGPPRPQEAEAVELLAYTAVRCVSLEGRERPSMSDVVDNLESSVALCEDNAGSISSSSIHSLD